MMQRILNSKNLVAFVLAAATGMTLYFRVPFPEGNIFLRVMALRSPSAFEVLKYSYTLFLFSTPYIGYSVVLSGLYVYECAIDNATLERKINEAERRLTETDSVLLWEEEYLKHPRDLEPFKFRLDEESKRYRAPLTPGLAAVLKDKAIQWEAENEKDKKPVPQDKKEQLEFQAWLRYKNANGADIYVGMNALRYHASTRTKDDIEKISHVYLDLDHGGAASLEALENSDLVPRPNYVLNTSPDKFQVVWKAEGMTIEEAESLNQAIVREFDGDPAATDATRVLRLPGFANKKYEADFYVQARAESTQTYHLRDFKLKFDSQDALRHHHEEVGRTQSASSSALSQSEHDWAYAKRALARGDDHEEVIRRITDYRASDKHDPAYYARHTVEKALKELRSGSADLQSCDGDTTHTSEPCQEQ